MTKRRCTFSGCHAVLVEGEGWVYPRSAPSTTIVHRHVWRRRWCSCSPRTTPVAGICMDIDNNWWNDCRLAEQIGNI